MIIVKMPFCIPDRIYLDCFWRTRKGKYRNSESCFEYWDRYARFPAQGINFLAQTIVAMPEISGILETAVYVADLPTSVSFYEKVFRFPVMYSDHRLCALNASPRQVLLLFLKGGSTQDSNTAGGIVPAHDGGGQLHLAFAIAKDGLESWEGWLREAGIPIESTVHWAAGGTSLYFRDPDGHLLELATPGLWANY